LRRDLLWIWVGMGWIWLGVAALSAQDAPEPLFLLSPRTPEVRSSRNGFPALHDRHAGDEAAAVPAFSNSNQGEKTSYGKIVVQSLMFLSLEHGFRLVQEKKTRSELSGRFFHDWFSAVKGLEGWNDDGSIFSNWICHPAQGSTSAFIFAQNHPQSLRAKFGTNKEYIHAKSKQFLFSLIYSVQFEIGPISECSIGNLGQWHGSESWQQRGKQAYVDQVVTPILGTAWSIGEDAIDQKFLRPFSEGHRYLGGVLCVFLNPTRSLANVFAFHAPWYRP
jgi:hypothetical protein